MKIINCTPHDVNIIDKNGNVIRTFKPEEKPARCRKVSVECIREIDGIKIGSTKRKVRVIENLPEKQEGVMIIVSKLTAQWALDRADLLVPLGVIKKDGVKIGCKKLGYVW